MGQKKAGDDLQHVTASLRLLPSGPDLVRIVPFYKVPGKGDMLSFFKIPCKLKESFIISLLTSLHWTAI